MTFVRPLDFLDGLRWDYTRAFERRSVQGTGVNKGRSPTRFAMLVAASAQEMQRMRRRRIE